MDEIEHLLSSLQDHLDAAEAKSLSDDAESDVEKAQSIASDITADGVDHEKIDTLLEILEEIKTTGTGNSEADSHIDAAKRAGERVLKR
ncbi:hypothetical protein ACFQJ7_12320 [Halovenus rubra]|uniref:DUF8152 domain-containing protein n=2 Tax=Halovenus rubra TaxID=869890 RepID=A0ABD5X6L1_9EURY|nr:hypothetical protein [Halovenus rubra]